MAISNKLPNMKCKFSGCTNGTDKYSIELNNGIKNRQKWIYACRNCVRNEVWKTVACCPEHFVAYQQEVVAARAKGRPILDANKPIMADMTDGEYKELMDAPVEQVEEETKQELTDAGYGEVLKEKGISGTVDFINQELQDEQQEEEQINFTNSDSNEPYKLRNKTRKNKFKQN